MLRIGPKYNWQSHSLGNKPFILFMYTEVLLVNFCLPGSITRKVLLKTLLKSSHLPQEHSYSKCCYEGKAYLGAQGVKWERNSAVWYNEEFHCIPTGSTRNLTINHSTINLLFCFNADTS